MKSNYCECSAQTMTIQTKGWQHILLERHSHPFFAVNSHRHLSIHVCSLKYVCYLLWYFFDFYCFRVSLEGTTPVSFFYPRLISPDCLRPSYYPVNFRIHWSNLTEGFLLVFWSGFHWMCREIWWQLTF